MERGQDHGEGPPSATARLHRLREYIAHNTHEIVLVGQPLERSRFEARREAVAAELAVKPIRKNPLR